MIAKISHGSSLYGVLAYNQLKVDERHADVLFTSRIIEPQGDAPYTIGHRQPQDREACPAHIS